MRVFLTFVALFVLLTACGSPIPRATVPDLRSENINKSPATIAKEKTAKAIEDLKGLSANGSELDKLKTEKKILQGQLEQNRAEEVTLRAALKAKDNEIGEERVNVARDRSYLFAGICGFLGAVALAVSFFLSVPLLAKLARFAAAACGALAVLFLMFAWLVPYLVPIVIGLAIIMAIGGIVGWRGDHKGLGQVIKAVEPIKNDVPMMAGRLRDALSPQVQKSVNRLRDAFGLRPKT